MFDTSQRSAWKDRISATGSGCDLEYSFQSHQSVFANNLASWWILENACDGICSFMSKNFEGYIIRERQVAKIRVEIPKLAANGQDKKLSALFGLIETNRQELKVQEYSIAQTSLEQIFNYFASQQEEETGHASGLSSN